MYHAAANTLKTWWQNVPPAWRFSLVLVTTLRIFYTVWSWFFLSSFSPVVQNQEFFGEPVVTVFDLQTSESYIYQRSVEGVLLTFEKYDNTHIADTQTGSLWQIRDGKSASSPNMGKNLTPAAMTSERVFPYNSVRAHPVPLLAVWQRFDVNWYLAIAQRGYGNVSGDVHFPPLYPIFIRLLSPVLRNDFLSALLISQISLYLMVKLLYDLFVEWGNERISEKALFFLLLFPTSFFFFSAYTEATFILFAILCLRAIQSRTWHWAGFWIFCAILVRLQGVVLFLPFVWGLVQTRLKQVSVLQLLVGGFSSLAAVGVYLLIRAASGDSSVIPIMETNLHARLVPPWENVMYSIRYLTQGTGGYIDFLNLVVFVVFSALILVYWKRFPVEYSLFALASLVLLSMRLVDTQPLNSMIRYVLTIFPVFYLLGLFAQHKWINLLMFACFLSLNLFLSAQFFLWGWVA